MIKIVVLSITHSVHTCHYPYQNTCYPDIGISCHRRNMSRFRYTGCQHHIYVRIHLDQFPPLVQGIDTFCLYYRMCQTHTAVCGHVICIYHRRLCLFTGRNIKHTFNHKSSEEVMNNRYLQTALEKRCANGDKTIRQASKS